MNECTCGREIDPENPSEHLDCLLAKQEIEFMEGKPCPSGCGERHYSRDEMDNHFCEQRISKAMGISDN